LFYIEEAQKGGTVRLGIKFPHQSSDPESSSLGMVMFLLMGLAALALTGLVWASAITSGYWVLGITLAIYLALALAVVLEAFRLLSR